MLDPIVIDPPGFDQKAAWTECGEYVEKCGGLTHEDGELNWKAAFGADPGCCSCPACHQMYWAWGNIQKCVKCGFEYPTDWWPMYSWGVQRKLNEIDPPPAFRDRKPSEHWQKECERRMEHPYYRYGYEHPVESPCRERDKVNWREVMAKYQS